MKRVIDTLINKKKTISTMESCTGGALANEITNVEGASEVFKFSAVTYSNEYKVKMRVNKNKIEKYSVYSIEIAQEMSKKICDFTQSSYGIGITGKFNCIDKNNPYGDNNKVFVSIYDKEFNKFYDYCLNIKENIRKKAKNQVVDSVIDKLLEIM